MGQADGSLSAENVPIATSLHIFHVFDKDKVNKQADKHMLNQESVVGLQMPGLIRDDAHDAKERVTRIGADG